MVHTYLISADNISQRLLYIYKEAVIIRQAKANPVNQLQVISWYLNHKVITTGLTKENNR